MLGPSGSGKTTVLRMIAGFEQPTAGHGRARRARTSPGAPPFERDVNTVFQDYALFPHMSVQENVEYGLRVKKVGQAERRARAAGGARDRSGSAATATAAPPSSPVASGSGSRWPARWSTGPRCCCSTSRSARSTSSCASEMQVELKEIQRDVGITFVFVTHDQEEALTMSDRIAVFNDGRIEQVGHARRALRAAGHARSSPASSAPPTCSTGRVAEQLLGTRRAPSASARRRSTLAPDAARRRAPRRGQAPARSRDVVYLGVGDPLGRRPRRRVAHPSTVLAAEPGDSLDHALTRRGDRVRAQLAARPPRRPRRPPRPGPRRPATGDRRTRI